MQTSQTAPACSSDTCQFGSALTIPGHLFANMTMSRTKANNCSRTHLLPNCFLVHVHIWTHNPIDIILVGCCFGYSAPLFWSLSKPSSVHISYVTVRHAPLPLSVSCVFWLILVVHMSLFLRTSKASYRFKIYLTNQHGYSQMPESKNMSNPSRWATVIQGRNTINSCFGNIPQPDLCFCKIQSRSWLNFLNGKHEPRGTVYLLKWCRTQQNSLQQFSNKL